MSPASPTPVNAVLRTASSLTTTRSQAIASETPAPNAKPSTAAMTGLEPPPQIARITRWAA